MPAEFDAACMVYQYYRYTNTSSSCSGSPSSDCLAWSCSLDRSLSSSRSHLLLGVAQAPSFSFPDLFRISHFIFCNSSIMSTASKVTLALTILGAIGIVVSVHYGQRAERAVCLRVNSFENLIWPSLGNARRRYSRYGAAETKKRAPTRFWHAAGTRERVQESPDRQWYNERCADAEGWMRIHGRNG